MLSKVQAAALRGVTALPVEVEVHVGPGEERIVVVGLPDAAVRESVERVSTSLTSSGYRLPPGKTTINLAPAGRIPCHEPWQPQDREPFH
jgi:magnesium chelatase family protein